MHKGHRSYTVTGIAGFDLRFFSGKKHMPNVLVKKEAGPVNQWFTEPAPSWVA